MSFILDALRKSELERQRDSAPGLMRSPVATIRRETPVWNWLLIVLLTLTLAGIAAAWWFRNSDFRTAATPDQQDVPAAETELSVASPVATAPDAIAEPAAEVETPLGGAAGATAEYTGEPKTMADLIRAYPNLPRYTLSFLQYNGADPDSGSAWINGERYYPGQAIAGGPALVGIQPDGALLAYRGQTYLLTPR